MIPAPPPFRYYLRVRYQECDAQGVVFNARYGDYVDIAMTEFLRNIGYRQALASGELDVQLVKQTTTWNAPTRNDQVLEISVRSMAQGTTSFTLITEFRRAGVLAITCEVETVYVRVEGKVLTKRPLGEDFRASLMRGSPGAIVDHAGYLNNLTGNYVT